LAIRSVALVEDERDVAAMYRLGLEMRGFAVAVTRDGPAFFESLETFLPDVVVLDWDLPTLTGGQVLSRLREDERTRRLPVLILSNMPRHDYAAQVMTRLGGLAWLEKMKTTPAELADKVTQVFGNQSPSN
jgi:DNA-binding response OmpR family regulator